MTAPARTRLRTRRIVALVALSVSLASFGLRACRQESVSPLGRTTAGGIEKLARGPRPGLALQRHPDNLPALVQLEVAQLGPLQVFKAILIQFNI